MNNTQPKLLPGVLLSTVPAQSLQLDCLCLNSRVVVFTGNCGTALVCFVGSVKIAYSSVAFEGCV